MISFNVQSTHMLADMMTPVGIYLQLRDKFVGIILLESSDYHGRENSMSFICCDPIGSFIVENEEIKISLPNGTKHRWKPHDRHEVLQRLQEFVFQFNPTIEDSALKTKPHGIYGYMGYDAVRYFEDIELKAREGAQEVTIPTIRYHLYRYIIAIDHFSNELVIFQNMLGEKPPYDLETLAMMIKSRNYPDYSFHASNNEIQNMNDAEYKKMISLGIERCQRGDVFQIVLSRRFEQRYSGDEFKLYRALRSINPSPYLFYFDYGSYKLIGSSPEAQIVIAHDKASIYPIAGTIKRTGNDEADLVLAQQLSKDEKENAEHLMLTDLARNDLSRNADKVCVECFKEVQFYSHVLHLVSKVTGTLKKKKDLSIVGATFPAGTLSGAPKYRAMELIDQYEPTGRANYGGAIGFIGFDGSFNHAILIRTFLCEGTRLLYQAGGGIIAKSTPQGELQEVNNKLAALRKAINLAEKL